MDEERLNKILGQWPDAKADPEARKRAVNLASAAFEEERKKISQGNGLLHRLMRKTNQQERRKPMNKRFLYGGMATAMAVILTFGGMNYVITQSTRSGGGHTGVATVSKITTGMPGGGQFSSIAANITGPVKRAKERESAEIAKVNKGPAQAESYTAYDSAVIAQAAPMPAAPRMEMSRMAPTGNMVIAPPHDMPAPHYYQDEGREEFAAFDESAVKMVGAEPVSTFSIDVDTASYAFVRRQLNMGVLPEKDAVRVEEMVNYFDYDYPASQSKEEPFKASVVVTPSPWAEGRKLIHIGIKGYEIPAAQNPRSNLVFLIDTSGSMNSPDKLPLLINSLKMLVNGMGAEDTVSIVTYAGSAGIVLEPTKGGDKGRILAALDALQAGGGTAGAAGIQTAYDLASANFDDEGVNRVILATDGDFNVGMHDPQELKDFIARKRDSGVFLSVLGFGTGNTDDATMQALAQNGNGTASYIDTLNEARKVLVEEAGATLFPIAKDVKIQVEFNPQTVAEYRLVGYETRALAHEDFNNDAVDAGDIGAGHSVTAIYEISPVGGPRTVDESRYATAEAMVKPDIKQEGGTDFGSEYAFLKIRYKQPEGKTSQLMTTPITTADESGKPESLLREAQWAASVAGFAQKLKGSKYTGNVTYDALITAAQGAKGADEYGYRAEFIQMMRMAQTLENGRE